MIRFRNRAPWPARAAPFIGPALYVATVLIVLSVSGLTGPSFDEIGRVATVERMGQVVTSVAARGLGALTEPQARAGFGEIDGCVSAPLIAAWSKLSIGRVGLLDPLTSLRLPWLLLAALGPACVFLIVAPNRGISVGLVAALLLLGMPRFVHGSGLGSETLAIAGLWLGVLVCYVRSLGRARPAPSAAPPRRMCWASAGGLLFALAVALSFAALWLLPILLAHFVAARFAAARRLFRRGRLAVPALVGFAACFLPVVVFLLNPPLWGTTAAQAARWLLAPLAPSVAATLYGARPVSGLAPPSVGYALDWLVYTLPSALLLAAFAGLVAIVHRALARRFASGRLRPARDRQALGALSVIGLAVVYFGPALLPPPLVRFPPRVELGLPFVAVLGALGLEALGRPVLSEGRRVLYAAPVVLSALVLSLFSPATQGAAFAPLLGGVRAVQKSQIFSESDGSELGLFAPAIDGLGRATLELHTSQVPPELWRTLVALQRLKTTVVSAPPERAAAELVRGPTASPSALARIRRDGAVLWTLTLTGR